MFDYLRNAKFMAALVTGLLLPSCSGSSSEEVVDLSLVDLTAGVWNVTGSQPAADISWDSSFTFSSQTANGNGWDLVGVYSAINTFQDGTVISGQANFTGTLGLDRSVLFATGEFTNVVPVSSLGFCPTQFSAELSASGTRLRRGAASPTGTTPSGGICPPGEWTADFVPGGGAVSPAFRSVTLTIVRADGTVARRRGVLLPQ